MAKGILNIGGGVVSVDASGNFTVETGLIADGSSVFNETGVDVDFRIESDDNANMFFVDGGNDRVGIGVATPASGLDVRGTVQVGIDDAGHDVIFYGDSASSNMTWDQNGNTDGQLILNDARLTIDQDDNVAAFVIDSEASSEWAFSIAAKYGMQVTQDISAGYAASISRNIGEAGSNPLVDIIDDHASCTQSTLRVRHDGTGSGSLALEVTGRMRLGGRSAAIQSPMVAWVMSG